LILPIISPTTLTPQAFACMYAFNKIPRHLGVTNPSRLHQLDCLPFYDYLLWVDLALIRENPGNVIGVITTSESTVNRFTFYLFLNGSTYSNWVMFLMLVFCFYVHECCLLRFLCKPKRANKRSLSSKDRFPWLYFKFGCLSCIIKKRFILQVPMNDETETHIMSRLLTNLWIWFGIGCALRISTSFRSHCFLKIAPAPITFS
jgi:hypothetical protein